MIPSHAAHPESHPTSRLTGLATFVVVTGILYFGRDVLIPLALSALLSFLLAPAVRHLERIGLGRMPATTVVAALSFGLIAGLLWITATQFLSLAESLPSYKDNIERKLGNLRTSPEGVLGKASRTIQEIGKEIEKQDAAEKAQAPGGSASTATPETPVSVKVEAPTVGALELIRSIAMPLVAPLTTAAAVIIFTFIMLLKREDLRDRMIRLVGHQQLNMTTQVLEEAGDRVSRYLRMQLIVNVSYGVPVGVALYLLGVPNAALWGLLATTLRFIPYIGSWIAAAFPIALAFAISDGWTLVIATVGVFLVLELISNNVIEPWLYGASTGMSPLAIMVAAIFWTWLWGAVGLLLATPLTVCLIVMGRYLPQLAYLNIMLGDEPVMSPQERFYQRLLAMDHDEATELAEDFVEAHGLPALYDQMLIPTLEIAERERHKNALTDERKRSILDGERRLIESLGSTDHPPASMTGDGARVPVCIVPARDEADELVGAMLAQSLAARGVHAEVFSVDLLKSEIVERVAALEPAVICVSALPPAGVLHATSLVKRLHALLPDAHIIAALWQAHGDISRARQRLTTAGTRTVLTDLGAAVSLIAGLDAAPPEQPPHVHEAPLTVAPLSMQTAGESPPAA
jgi:predicted PurR-regulated permease PerM